MKTVLYTISTLQRSGPALVLYGLVKNIDKTEYTPVVLTLSEEKENSVKPQFDAMKIPSYCLGKRGIRTFISGGFKFRKIIKEVNPDIIHANGFRDILLTAFFAPKKYKRCATIHCDWAVDYVLKYGRFIGKISSLIQTVALKFIPVKIACSQMLADLLNKKYPSLGFKAVNNGVDTDIYHKVSDKNILREKLSLPKDKKIIIWAGSFIPRKNPIEMAETILKIEENKYFFVFCGARGPLLPKCKEVLKNRKDVLFTGYITNMSQYYQASDVYVSTSLSEGLPLAVLEAACCGNQLFLSDIPQHKYLASFVSVKIYKNEELISLLKNLSDSNKFLTDIAKCSAYIMANDYMCIYEESI